MTSPASLQRPAAGPDLLRNPVIAVLRAGHADQYAPVIESLLTGGLSSIELTLSTPGALEELPRLLDRFGAAAEIGIGTVTGIEQARRAIDAGAAYIVTPVMDLPTVGLCVERGIPVYPGGLTPTELLAGWNAGATAVKLFPASTVGPGYIGQLRGPFPDISVIPSGGIGINDVPGWIEAGALAVSLGGPLLQDAFAGGNPAGLIQRAREVSELVARSRPAPAPQGAEE
ncbi:bifunctional 4-hydroxy-2-oxoglutarate aldolase/2-dehydro-3-deoxy-phosphogluconate aldolase [Arthrobacter crusticola]|uniref:Bifunctional 4-hydroxy-2-oxoglutarate aldolase/2-dehydro-3-deoxy-phosphogluconate aldolase n=1 Tax=Arthrobacter crusticola TaxID=2547960 RepID=A0A4R5TW41_9MICC|nr:bifunctional 4-hydroxy-2-oxoglutarate aldolase/2-dehydro-3-deoxy-phosphogluconate aldolase [Arthrobacter crusticola]TDK25354.1 bifunctional 4-hydroxy-2-oxoglutarate aldolase/2-dehydro-3-deoxy-phosphogluconate aldolase [Arthrobacter crusticola]